MGYSTSYAAFTRGQKYLDILKISKEPISWTSREAQALQYRIHNALKVAEALKVPGYEHLRSKWRIRFKGMSVVAIPLDTELEAITFRDFHDPYEIVDKLTKLKSATCNIVFMDAALSEEDTRLVENWCSKNNFSLKVIGKSLYCTPEGANK